MTELNRVTGLTDAQLEAVRSGRTGWVRGRATTLAVLRRRGLVERGIPRDRWVLSEAGWEMVELMKRTPVRVYVPRTDLDRRVEVLDGAVQLAVAETLADAGEGDGRLPLPRDWQSTDCFVEVARAVLAQADDRPAARAYARRVGLR